MQRPPWYHRKRENALLPLCQGSASISRSELCPHLNVCTALVIQKQVLFPSENTSHEWNSNREKKNQWTLVIMTSLCPVASPSTPCHPNDSLPDLNGHFWKFLGNESTETVLQHLHSTSAIRDIYSQDLQQQWIPLIHATAAIRLTQLDSFPGEISVYLLALIWLSKGFQLKGYCCGSMALQRAKGQKYYCKKVRKSVTFCADLGVPLSNDWKKSKRIPVHRAPLVQLVLETLQKDKDMDTLQLLFAPNAD